MISVIIPVYNNHKQLEKCLASLERQNFKDFEVIVVDDGSIRPRGFEFLVPNFQFSPIFFYRIKHGGAPKARNFGFEKSRGEFVLFCDADMELREDCLEKMIKILKNNPDKAYAYSDFKYGFKKFKFWQFDAVKLKKNNYINTCSLLRRKDFINWDEKLNRFQDWDLWLSLLEKGKIGVYIPEVLLKADAKSGKISQWLPRFLYKFPWLKKVKEYNRAKKVIVQKHSLR